MTEAIFDRRTASKFLDVVLVALTTTDLFGRNDEKL